MFEVKNSKYHINFAQQDGLQKSVVHTPVNTSTVVQEDSFNPSLSNHKRTRITGAITGMAVLGALAVITLVKGIPVSKGKINDLILNLGQKGRKLKNKEIKSGFETFVVGIIDKSQAAVNFSKIALNFTSLKDVGFKKITDKIPFIGKFFRKITGAAEQISVKMVKKSYTKTNKQFSKLYSAFYDANVNLPKTQIDNFEKGVTDFRKAVINSFGTEETGFRLKRIRNIFKDIGENIWDITYKTPKKFLSSRGAYTNCVAEQISVAAKADMAANVNRIRAAISNTPKNDITYIKNLLSNINSVLDPLADDTINAMKKVESRLKKFSKSNTQEARDALLESINNLNKLVQDEKMQNVFAKNIEEMRIPKSGQLQELLSQYKSVLSDKDYQKLEKAANKAMNSLDKSVNLETGKLFDKMRDLEIGSAPTDIVSILSTVGAVGYGLSLADTKDERISAALRYGIPALGAVTVSLICTTSLIAAGPSFGIGLLSGLIMNKIGSFTDKIRKAMSEEPKKLTESAKK